MSPSCPEVREAAAAGRAERRDVRTQDAARYTGRMPQLPGSSRSRGGIEAYVPFLDTSFCAAAYLNDFMPAAIWRQAAQPRGAVSTALRISAQKLLQTLPLYARFETHLTAAPRTVSETLLPCRLRADLSTPFVYITRPVQCTCGVADCVLLACRVDLPAWGRCPSPQRCHERHGKRRSCRREQC